MFTLPRNAVTAQWTPLAALPGVRRMKWTRAPWSCRTQHRPLESPAAVTTNSRVVATLNPNVTDAAIAHTTMTTSTCKGEVAKLEERTGPATGLRFQLTAKVHVVPCPSMKRLQLGSAAALN